MSGTGLSYLSLSEALQDVFLRQRTGVVAVTHGGERDRFVVLSGQLYLSGSNPLRGRLERVLQAPEVDEVAHFDARRYLRDELGSLVRDLADIVGSWAGTEIEFSDEPGEIPDDIVGPLPTAELVMDLYTRGWALDELLERLGGRRASYRAAEDPSLNERVPNLDAGEVRMLERLRRPATVEELLSGESETLLAVCRLVRLSAVGLIEVESGLGVGGASVAPAARRQIYDRVRQDLEREPLVIDPVRHRAVVEALIKDYGRRDYHELLEVDTAATTEEVHAAFVRLARRVHPCHAAALDMSTEARKLEWLFGRLTEAYLVLSDPERAAEYRRRSGAALLPRRTAPDETARRTERVRLARESYRVALDYLEEDDYYYAIEMLRRATLMDERPEYYALLGRCQMQNPKWLHMAVDSIRRALALRPDDQELRHELAEVTRQFREHREREAARRRPVGAPPRDADAVRGRRLLSKLRGTDERAGGGSSGLDRDKI